MKVKILEGNCIDALKSLPDESVHTVITSPPYFGLRSYGTNPQVWGGQVLCKHVWEGKRTKRPNASGGQNSKKLKTKGTENFQASVDYKDRAGYSDVCHCGAWRGELGMEPTPQLFVKNLVTIFKEVWRVLHKSGVLWLNISDSYNGSGGAGGDYNGNGLKAGQAKYPGRKIPGLKSGDLCGVPWMLAMALRDDGWYLRGSQIWCKGLSFCSSYSGSVMPESVTSRPTRSHEYVFLLAKDPKYFYDNEAIREPDCGGGGGRNIRSVWTIPLEQFPGPHFAVMPTALIVPCIKSGTSEKGVCSKCRAPYERIIEKISLGEKQETETPFEWDCESWAHQGPKEMPEGMIEYKTIGWKQSCKCKGTSVVPATVLDPFGGAGTTALVAHTLDRNSISIELNPQYCDLQERRLRDAADLFIDIDREKI